MKLHRTAGQSFTTVEIGGKTYTLRPLRIGDYAAMEAFIIAQREDVLVIAARACQRAPQEQHGTIWEAALRAERASRTVSAEETAKFEGSVRGLAWKLWHCLKDHHPELTLDDTLGLIAQAGEQRLAELQAKIHVASGEADLKNSSGQPGVEAARVTPLNPLVGQQCTSGSPSCTDGDQIPSTY